MSPLLTRWFRSARTETDPTIAVTVYSRPGCGCCERALEVIEGQGKSRPLAISVVNIDEDPALVERFSTAVPVVEINGKIRFRGLVNPILLDRLLEAERR